jgi:hypothetical protein
MNVRFLIFALVMLLAGCNRQGDAQARKNLPGTWTLVADGKNPKSTIIVDPNGDYICEVIAQSSWDGVTRTYNLAGRWEVRDGILIDTMTKNSSTNARLPMISRSRIVRSDRRELVINVETNSSGDFLTNEVVFRKEIK